MHKPSVVNRITLLAMLASISAIIKIIFQATTGPAARLTFYELPIILAGSIFWPLSGMIVAYVSDLGYALNMGYGAIPNLMTVSALMWGLLSGLILYKRQITLKRIIAVILLASTFEFLINGTQLFLWNLGTDPSLTWTMFMTSSAVRSIILIGKWPLQIYLMHLVYTRVMDASPLVMVNLKSVNPVLD